MSGGADAASASASSASSGMIATARGAAGEVPRRAHHDGPRAGGKATQTLIEGLLVPAFGSEALAELGDAGGGDGRRARPGVHDRQLRRQADPLPGRLDRRAGRQRHGQRPRGGRRAAARADPRDGARGGAARPTCCARRSRRSPRRPRRPACRSSPATRRSSSAATRTRCTSARRASGWSTSARALAPARLRPGDRVIVSGSIGEHGTAIMLARGEFDLDADVESDTRRCGPRSTRCSTAAGPAPALPARRDARRRGVGAQRAGARLRAWRCVVREARRPGAAGRRRRGGDPRDRPDVHRQRGRRSSRSSRPSGRTPRWPRCAPCRACEGAVAIGEVKTEPAGMVLVETAFGGKRVMDQLVGDPLPRIC